MVFFLKGNMYVANHWGVCFGTLWNHTSCVPSRGVTLLSRRCGSRKVSAIHARRRGFIPLLWSPEFPVAGPGLLVKDWCLGTVDENWTGLWQDSSEESLNLLVGLWWAGSGVGHHMVLRGMPAVLRCGWVDGFQPAPFRSCPSIYFSASYVRTFNHMPRQKLWFLGGFICFSFVPMSYTIRTYPAIAVGKACHTVIVRIVSLVAE